MVKLAPMLFGVAVSVAYGSDASQCTQYTPVGFDGNRGKINFYDNNPTDNPANGHGFHAPTLPANATASNAWMLSDHNNSTGTVFHFRACKSTTLGLTTNTTQSSCSDGGCYITYTNYIQVINPPTGHCLTAINGWNATETKLDFKNCTEDITNRDQLWETDQQVLYSPGFGKITSYGQVQFNIIEVIQGGGPFLAWALDRSDNKTIEVIQYPYTQDGLSANIVMAPPKQ